jgi:hypothetical protein
MVGELQQVELGEAYRRAGNSLKGQLKQYLETWTLDCCQYHALRPEFQNYLSKIS